MRLGERLADNETGNGPIEEGEKMAEGLGNDRDLVLEKLDILIEGQEVTNDLLEEVMAKLDDLEVVDELVPTF